MILMRWAASRLIARNPLTASGMRVFDRRWTVALPSRWSRRLTGPKWLVADAAVADDDVRLPAHDRLDQPGDVPPSYWSSASVLTMMSAPSAAPAPAPTNAAARPLLRAVADDVMDAELRATSLVPSLLPSSITRIFDDVDAADGARERRQRFRQMIPLVVTGDLNDQLHRPSLRRSLWRSGRMKSRRRIVRARLEQRRLTGQPAAPKGVQG